MNTTPKRSYTSTTNIVRAFGGCLLSLVLLFGLEARAWNVIDLANGTNYVTISSGSGNNVSATNRLYFGSYQITNDSSMAYSNIWVKISTFTNGVTQNILLGASSTDRKLIGTVPANGAVSFYFALVGTNVTTSSTNTINVYYGDPNNSGQLLTNVLFTKNYIENVTTTANGNAAGTNILSSYAPTLGSFLVMTSTFTAGSSGKVGLYGCYPAVNTNWDASVFSLVSNTVSYNGTTFPNKMIFAWPSIGAGKLTNVAVFRVVGVKPTQTPISSGGYVNTGQGAVPDCILPATGASVSSIPPTTNSMLLTNWSSATSAYTNTIVYFTNQFKNTGLLDSTVVQLVATLPAGFVYAGNATFAGFAIAAPVTNAPTATNYTVTFGEGYYVPAGNTASLVFAAMPTNSLDVAGNVTNVAMLTTYSSYGLIGTNHIDLTYDTMDIATPTNQVRVLLNPIATNDAYSVNENAALTINAAAGVLGNDNEPNGFTKTVMTSLTSTPAHGALTLNPDGSFTYTPTSLYNGSDSFTYTMTNGNDRASTATVNLTINFVNHAPTLAAINPLTLSVNASQQTVNLSGIAASALASAAGSAILESGQSLTVTATSSNTGLIPNPTATYTSANTTGSLAFTPVAHQTGSATITVIVQDSGGTANGGVNSVTNTFTVTVNKPTPTVTVNVGSYTYNGTAQGPTTATTPSTGAVTWSYTGVSGTSYGPSATPPTGAGSYTATATVAADTDYISASSSATAFTIGKATPTISGVTASQSITYGTAGITLTGTVSVAGGGYPAIGETVSATINGHLVNGAVNNSTGGFSITYDDSSLANDPISGSPYTITYAYGGGANLNAAANNTATTLTITAGAVNAAQSTVTASPTSVTADGTTTSTVTVTLKDAYGNPVPGKTVSLAKSSGPGTPTITTTQGTTDASGAATFTVKSTTAGADVFAATDVTDSNLAITQTATVTFTAGAVTAAQSTVIASPTSVIDDGIETSTITVTLKDANGNPVPGKTVTLAKSSGPGTPTITTIQGTTDASGVATFTVKATLEGIYVFTATDVTDSNLIITQTADVTFTNSAVTDEYCTVSASPASVTADGTTTSTITVTLKDTTGDPVPGKTVTLAKSSGPGSPTITTTQGTTDASGVATFTVKSTTAAVDVFTATDTSDNLVITQTATVTFTPGPASQLVFTTQPSASTVAGVAFATQPVVKIEDQYGNVVTSGADSTVTVTLTRTTGAGTLAGTVSKTAVAGVADFSGLGLNINRVGTDKVLTATATLAAGEKTTTTSPAFVITLPPVSILRGPGAGIKIYASTLLAANAAWDDYTLTYVSSDTTTTNEVYLAISHPASDTRIVYPSSAANVADLFHYSVSDSHGDTWAGTVNIVINTNLTGQAGTITNSGSGITLTFYGVPGYHYAVQRTADLNGATGWADIPVTSTDASVNGTILTAPLGGAFTVTDVSPPSGSAYYRLRAAP